MKRKRLATTVDDIVTVGDLYGNGDELVYNRDESGRAVLENIAEQGELDEKLYNGIVDRINAFYESEKQQYPEWKDYIESNRILQLDAVEKLYNRG